MATIFYNPPVQIAASVVSNAVTTITEQFSIDALGIFIGTIYHVGFDIMLCILAIRILVLVIKLIRRDNIKCEIDKLKSSVIGCMAYWAMVYFVKFAEIIVYSIV